MNGKWYYVDLTNGVGTGKHEGAVVSYESFLVGKKGFLKDTSGIQGERFIMVRVIRTDLNSAGNSDF